MGDRAVAYLNTDICVSNAYSILAPHVAPLLRDRFFAATKAIPNYYDPTESYYDFWVRWALEDGLDEPQLDLPCEHSRESVFEYCTTRTRKTRSRDPLSPPFPASGSDHAGFMFTAGVPIVDVGMADDPHVYPALDNTGYPTYHTGFETVRLVEEIADPGFVQHRFCAQLNMYMAR